ncbi:hypothetical protein KI387_030806, partial [Taxus chinensis]
RILTGDNLMERGMVGPFWCPLCKEVAETLIHLFLQCPFVTSLWNILADWISVTWNFSMNLVDTLRGWKRSVTDTQDFNKFPQDMPFPFLKRNAGFVHLSLPKEHNIFSDFVQNAFRNGGYHHQ